ncbi:right-handed parallel beta-helix repeat-containing protein [Metabacillus arenae]|uniref:Right-handed parallel beta-helix repeat-containing protein n=1 Tax=Metabacillus arenae TaxID=2771434 RepID=A0A926RV28_9BACI|nr:right-handed parallel beta-helix repeat-containing protein [Metabacillus arenae]MBD1379233.1 right-handed parallel beta-helix repeat-containing protein [Metabacillus arenae]
MANLRYKNPTTQEWENVKIEAIGSSIPNEESWVSTEGQTTFTLSNGKAIDKKLLTLIVGGVTQYDYTLTNEKIITVPEPLPAGLKVIARWFEVKVPATAGHTSTHEVGGQDEIDVTKLKNYDEEVGNKITTVMSDLADTSADLKDRGINVLLPPYNVSGSSQITTGSINSGSNTLTVSSPIDFKVGQGIAIKTVSAVADVKTLQITSGATTTGSVSISFQAAAYIIEVNAGDTAIQVADKIRSAVFNDFTTGGTSGTDTITFTANVAGEKPSMSYDPSTTGASGTVTQTTVGVKDSYFISEITALNGNSITLQNSATVTVSGVLVLHDDTAAIQTAINDLPSDGGELIIPKGTYNYSANWTIANKSNVTFRGVGRKTVLCALNYTNSTLWVNDCTGVVIKNFRIKSSGTKRLQTDASTGIRPSNCTDIQIKSVYVEKTSAGILARQCTDLVVKNCNVKDTFADGIHITRRCKEVRVLNNYLENTGDDAIAVVSYTADGIAAEVSSLMISGGATTTGRIQVVLDGLIHNINVTSGDTPTTIATNVRSTLFTGWTTGGSGTTITFTSASNGDEVNARFISNGTGVVGTISTTTQGEGYCEKVIIAHNTIKNGKTRAITHVGGKNVVISDNIINGTASSGILIMKDNNYDTFKPLDTIVKGNQIKNVGTVLPNAGNISGIETQVDTKGCLIESNVISHGTGRGFLLAGSSIIVKGNLSYRNFGANQINPSNQVIVEGNRFEENGEQGLSIVNSVNITVSNNIAINNNTKEVVGVDNYYFTGCSKGIIANNNSIDNRAPAKIDRSYEYNNCTFMKLSGNRQEGGLSFSIFGTSSSFDLIDGLTGSGVPTTTFYASGQRYTDTTNGDLYFYLGSTWKKATVS